MTTLELLILRIRKSDVTSSFSLLQGQYPVDVAYVLNSVLFLTTLNMLFLLNSMLLTKMFPKYFEKMFEVFSYTSNPPHRNSSNFSMKFDKFCTKLRY